MNNTDVLIALEAIRQLKARYLRFVDTKQWDGFQALFCDDATMDISDDVPDLILTGSQVIRDAVSHSLAECLSVHQGFMPELDILSPTEARGLWAMQDKLQWTRDCGNGIRDLDGWGHYHETYRKVGDEWRIQTLKLTRLRLDAVRW